MIARGVYMKKAVILFVGIVLFIGMFIAANAIEENRPLTDLLTESPNAGGLVPEVDSSLIPDSLSSIDGKPVLVMLPVLKWKYVAELPIEEAIQKTYDDVGALYIVIEENSRTIIDASTTMYKSPNNLGNSWSNLDYVLSDIRGGVNQLFLGTEYTIENVICIGDMFDYEVDRIVYYFTDGGVFVRFYEHDSPAVEFSLQDFQENAQKFYSFLTSYEFTYDENGTQRSFVGGFSFISYTEYPEWYHERVRHQSLTERYPLIYLILVVCCLVICVFFARRIRKKKGSTQSDTRAMKLFSNYISMLIIFMLYLLADIVFYQCRLFDTSIFAMYERYFRSLAVAVALAGVVDMILGLRIKSALCRLFSLTSGGLSILVILFAFGIDLGFEDAIYLLVPILSVMILACWVVRGILFYQNQNKLSDS